MKEKNVENLTIAATVIVIAITLCICIVTAIKAEHQGDHDRQMKKIAAIHACEKSTEPAICLAAIHP